MKKAIVEMYNVDATPVYAGKPVLKKDVPVDVPAVLKRKEEKWKCFSSLF